MLQALEVHLEIVVPRRVLQFVLFIKDIGLDHRAKRLALATQTASILFGLVLRVAFFLLYFLLF